LKLIKIIINIYKLNINSYVDQTLDGKTTLACFFIHFRDQPFPKESVLVLGSRDLAISGEALLKEAYSKNVNLLLDVVSIGRNRKISDTILFSDIIDDYDLTKRDSTTFYKDVIQLCGYADSNELVNELKEKRKSKNIVLLFFSDGKQEYPFSVVQFANKNPVTNRGGNICDIGLLSAILDNTINSYITEHELLHSFGATDKAIPDKDFIDISADIMNYQATLSFLHNLFTPTFSEIGWDEEDSLIGGILQVSDDNKVADLEDGSVAEILTENPAGDIIDKQERCALDTKNMLILSFPYQMRRLIMDISSMQTYQITKWFERFLTLLCWKNNP
jgi:hypothetical protein